ncbi:hypothetical protein [Devosia chinhatensis]|uniref:hypothetical protein n=1 Tax=Devosia chinhatensis TaxID=429727 RepID=UPI000ADD9DBE|nr:hypothetical protein [Devosia chinhatensis]
MAMPVRVPGIGPVVERWQSLALGGFLMTRANEVLTSAASPAYRDLLTKRIV